MIMASNNGRKAAVINVQPLTADSALTIYIPAIFQ